MELARGWKFACTCTRCKEEDGGDGSDGSPAKDESKLEAPVQRWESADGEDSDP